ncbi:MAG TPA: CapA family protein [Mycobacteriales bacterium]|jgi:poly-gamma-glutamate synthesis protein (capsule biosynthesis protein)|nr:CapA family protein [Mycobacteriales bacterium]
MRNAAAVAAALALAACGSPAKPAARPTPSRATTSAAAPTTQPPTTPRTTPAGTPTASPLTFSSPTGSVTLVFGGDVDFDRTTRTAIANGGVDAPWRYLAPTLRAADVAMLNLECSVSRRGAPEQKTYRFRGDPSAVAGARNAGVDVFSSANNHSIDYGFDAFADTLAAVRAQGIRSVGAGRDLAEAQRPAVFVVNGRRIAFVGISAIIPAPKWKAAPGHPGVAYDDDAQITEQVRKAKAVADIVIPYFHWGIEYTYSPSAAQRRAARAAIRAGATMVVGTHPHVLQPIEVVDGHLVAWSLSNLVFQSRPASVHTELLKVTINRDGSVDWATEPYLISAGVPRPEPSRRPQTGHVPA